jgi:ferrochelatase
VSESTTRGVLLVNVGSPDSPEPADVRRFLAEFLDDPRVIDIPAVWRKLLLHLFILPFRPRRSSEAYRQIWTEEGSPLVAISLRVAEALRARVEIPVEVAMRYGRPSLSSAVQALLDHGVDHLLLIPLFPHYAMSSYETAVERTREVLADLGPAVALDVQPPFYDDPDYIEALYAVARPALEAGPDRVLFSFHGVPERQVRKTDPSGAFCLEVEDCCDRSHPAQAFCYRHQVFVTARALAERGGLGPEQWSVAFQSRLGRTPWLGPFADQVLRELPGKGVRDLVVLCPSFVSDCLETLEEMGIRGRETFLAAGGERFTLVPCLNTAPPWIAFLERLVNDWAERD